STPVQVVYRDAQVPVRRVELNVSQTESGYLEAMHANAIQRMNVSSAPLLSLCIGQVANTEQYYLLVQFHHLISDHVGMEIIGRELMLFFQGRAQELAPPHPYRELIAHVQHQAQHHDYESYFKAQ